MVGAVNSCTKCGALLLEGVGPLCPTCNLAWTGISCPDGEMLAEFAKFLNEPKQRTAVVTQKDLAERLAAEFKNAGINFNTDDSTSRWDPKTQTVKTEIKVPSALVPELMARDDITLIPSDLLAALNGGVGDSYEHPRSFATWLAGLTPDRLAEYRSEYLQRLAKWVLK